MNVKNERPVCDIIHQKKTKCGKLIIEMPLHCTLFYSNYLMAKVCGRPHLCVCLITDCWHITAYGLQRQCLLQSAWHLSTNIVWLSLCSSIFLKQKKKQEKAGGETVGDISVGFTVTTQHKIPTVLPSYVMMFAKTHRFQWAIRKHIQIDRQAAHLEWYNCS